jgi:hypothetical protein
MTKTGSLLIKENSDVQYVPPPLRSFRIIFILILLLGVGLRLAWVTRPFDHRIRTSWRQSDYIQIARNFEREGMNILFPRIDWRGDTPGYVEGEFPLVPWVGAVLYKIFGYQEWFLRTIPCFFSLLSLVLMGWLAVRLLPPGGALFATAAFAFNPLMVYLSTSIQPESTMIFLSLAAFAFLVRWDSESSFGNLLIASLFTGAAILAKSPAASVGLALGFVILRRNGLRTFVDLRVIVAGVTGVLPPLLWYGWAHRFYVVYGNSLGLSNESHYIGLDLLFPPAFLLGNLKWETLFVFTPCGWLLFLAALGASKRRLQPELIWYGAVWVFYVLAARTSGDDWAYYYHCSSVAPACLLMGAGYDRLVGRLHAKPRLVLGACTLLALLLMTTFLIYKRDTNDDLLPVREASLQFALDVPPSGMIVVKGGKKVDEKGFPVAYNEPMVFAWMDRKGFNYAPEDLSLATLEELCSRGGRYWVMRESEIPGMPEGMIEEVEKRFVLLANGPGGYRLYDLKPADKPANTPDSL